MILNSQSDLFVHLMQVWLSRSVSSSRRNCHSWICDPVLNSTCGEDAAPAVWNILAIFNCRVELAYMYLHVYLYIQMIIIIRELVDYFGMY